MHKPLFIVFIVSLLVGCVSSGTATKQAVPAAKQQAETFESFPDRANIYIKMEDGYWDIAGRLVVDKLEMGLMNTGDYINFQTAPGEYSFNVSNETGTLLAQFDIGVEVGAVVLIECDPVKGFGVLKRSTGPVLQPRKMCDASNVSNSDGLSACIIPFSEPNLSGDRIHTEPWSSCSVAVSTKPFTTARLVQASHAYITSPDSDYRRAVVLHTVADYQAFLAAYPNSPRKPELLETIAALREVESEQRKQQQISDTFKRDASLPLTVRKDKYMLVLTNNLKNQKFKEALVYFEILEKMNVQLSSSFDYFWGEALLKTGQPQAALDKLYGYIKASGSNGQYYFKALELATEAEAQL